MKNPSADAILGAGVMCIAGGTVFFLSSAGVATLDWKPEVWAAWVQAMGSIPAIVGAFALARQQERASERIRQRDRLDEYLLGLNSSLEAIRDAIGAFRGDVGDVTVEWKSRHFHGSSHRVGPHLSRAQLDARDEIEARGIPFEPNTDDLTEYTRLRLRLVEIEGELT